jgi:hypothetical protein
MNMGVENRFAVEEAGVDFTSADGTHILVHLNLLR